MSGEQPPVWQAGSVPDPSPAAAPGRGPQEPLTPAQTRAAYGLVLLLTVLVSLWGAFLVPLRWGATPLPVAWVIAAAGNLALGWAGARLLGRRGVLGPAVLWLVIALTLGSKRGEGDLVIPGTTIGLVYLLVGAVASAVAYGLAPRDPR